MIISKEKLKKASRTNKIFDIAKCVLGVVAVFVFILGLCVLDSNTVPNWYMGIAMAVFVAILVILCVLPEIQEAMVVRATGLRRGQTVYIACPERSLSVKETTIIKVYPDNVGNPVATAEAWKLFNVETSDLYLTYEEAEQALDESIEKVCGIIKDYVGYDGDLSEGSKEKLMNYYSEYISNLTIAKTFGGRKHIDSDWLSGLAEYIMHTEKRRAIERAKKEVDEKAAREEAERREAENKKYLKDFIS